MKDFILAHYSRNLVTANRLLADIPDEAMADQAAGIVNHPAWQIGHLCMSADFVLTLLTGRGNLAPDWRTRFGIGSQPQPDRSAYPPKAELLALLACQHAAVADAFAKADAAALEAPAPERVRAVFPRAGDIVVGLMTGHESHHLGTLSAWRRVRGKPSLY
ncbi:MAG: hypothetical protein BIFFINMI_02596 [Phycisphaerae bacterium]|nr:hypothetical protein [Phycisphaerae bacterium]